MVRKRALFKRFSCRVENNLFSYFPGKKFRVRQRKQIWSERALIVSNLKSYWWSIKKTRWMRLLANDRVCWVQSQYWQYYTNTHTYTALHYGTASNPIDIIRSLLTTFLLALFRVFFSISEWSLSICHCNETFAYTIWTSTSQ